MAVHCLALGVRVNTRARCGHIWYLLLIVDFGTEENIIEMASSEKVLFMKKFSIVNMNISKFGSSPSDRSDLGQSLRANIVA